MNSFAKFLNEARTFSQSRAGNTDPLSELLPVWGFGESKSAMIKPLAMLGLMQRTQEADMAAACQHLGKEARESQKTLFTEVIVPSMDDAFMACLTSVALQITSLAALYEQEGKKQFYKKHLRSPNPEELKEINKASWAHSATGMVEAIAQALQVNDPFTSAAKKGL